MFWYGIGCQCDLSNLKIIKCMKFCYSEGAQLNDNVTELYSSLVLSIREFADDFTVVIEI